MDLPNYIPDVNRFHLAGPPAWFLRALRAFDPSLVIIPSRQGFYYRLAQRRRLRLPERFVNDLLAGESDTRMLASYGLVPVTTILATVNWSDPLIFQELAARAPWRMPPGQYADQVERQDQDREARVNQQVDAYLTDLSKDAWRLYRKKVGLGRSWSAPGVAPRCA